MATQSVSRAPWFRRGLLQAYHYLSPAAVCSHTGGGVASLSTDGKSSQDSVTDTEGTQDRYGTRTVIRGLYPSGVPLFGRIRHGSALHYQYSYITMRRNLHSSSFVRGLEEFFPKSDNIIEEGEKTGRPWLARELRQKSSEDLHKLWYVLLKETNMLLTLKHDGRRAGFIMPAPERLWKVRKSMARIKLVVGERQRAIRKAKSILLKKKGERDELKIQESAENIQTDGANKPAGSSDINTDRERKAALQ